MADYPSIRVTEPASLRALAFETYFEVVFSDTLAETAITYSTKFIQGDDSNWYFMRAWNTSLSSFVHWRVSSFPDFTGTFSGYPVGDIQDAVVVLKSTC